MTEQEIIREFEEKHAQHVPFTCMEEMKRDFRDAFSRHRLSLVEEVENLRETEDSYRRKPITIFDTYAEVRGFNFALDAIIDLLKR